jgi:hypothetical protein
MALRSSSLRRRVMLGLAIGLTALSLAITPATAPGTALATTGAGQSDPAWDYGRGGAEAPGQPACYMPSPGEPTRKMYNLGRPACFPGHLF